MGVKQTLSRFPRGCNSFIDPRVTFLYLVWRPGEAKLPCEFAMFRRCPRASVWIIVSLMAAASVHLLQYVTVRYKYSLSTLLRHSQNPSRPRDVRYEEDNEDNGTCSNFPKNMFQFVHGVQSKRLGLLTHRCRRLHSNYTTQSFLNKLNNNLGFYDPFRFLYCRIQKVGSTFLRRTMKKLFDGVDYQALQGRRMILNRSEAFIDCLSKTSKFMFVREPYGRALSGYVDKLFAPNPVYWTSIGRHVVHDIRGLNASDLSLKCGHDVTFPEFMKYLIVSQKKSKHRDRHFYPMYEHCFPCDVKYDFIGKLETFQDDVSILLDSFNSTFSVEMSFNDFELESDLTTAKGHVGLLYHFRKKTLKCEPFHKSLRRLWRDLQIRGVLPIDVRMPFSPQQARTVLQSEVVSEINKTIHTIQNRTKVKKQRQEAKLEAFGLVSIEILKEYRQLFHLDFELFDYPSNPSFIENRNVTKRLKYFNIL